LPAISAADPSPAAVTATQLRPLLSEIAALRRVQQGLQKQAGQLQLQLSAAERDAQTASSAAAADKALAHRTITQAHHRLSAALQRLKALAERQQQQSLLLQEVSPMPCCTTAKQAAAPNLNWPLMSA
jgi:septal ring factor EnvC (AmiA/AmiB activator)